MPKSNSITREECFSTHKTMNDKLDNLVEKVGDIAVTVAALPGNLIKELDERYADKKTEKAVDRVTWLVISSVIITGLALLYSK